MYSTLLVPKRIRISSRGEKSLVEEVESDRARVLYSASFRRLQRKTQVFPLEDNASVRTRMTHSLEVAHVGRFLASSVLGVFSERSLLDSFELTTERQHAFSTTVEVACLLHDIGNPPFGHFGEVAISRWFSKLDIFGDYKLDFDGFDGNPQGFRIISRIAGDDGLTGMNLTLSQLAATVKYSVNPEEQKSSNLKKFGIFFSENQTLGKIRAQFNLKPEQRHPLAYLMEAADDISYCLSDIEDGAEKGIVRYQDIVQDLLENAEDEDVREIILDAEQVADSAQSVNKIVSFRSHLIRGLVKYAANRYADDHDQILSGDIDELIDKNSSHGKLLKVIKNVVRGKVYSHHTVQSLELSGLAAITALLESFGQLLRLDRDVFTSLISEGKSKRGLEVEKRLCDFIAPSHKYAYNVASQAVDGKDAELWLRAHMLVDYISGMTDSFAIEMHQILGGLRI